MSAARMHSKPSPTVETHNAQDVKSETPVASKKKKRDKKPDVGERIYSFLDKLERVATAAKRMNKKRKRSLKTEKKKTKKLCKHNKKTGAWTYKKVKHEKAAKPLKPYKPTKSKK